MVEAIFAPITAQGRSGVNVVRISGSLELLQQCEQKLRIHKVLHPRMATLVSIYDGDQLLDQALATYFAAPHSFTGEEVLELALHASPYILKRLLIRLGEVPQVRMAEPGEFSKRAFLHHKLDLTQAEGIADLIAAETASQHRQAMHQYQGALGTLYESWRQKLLDIMAYVESYLDFPEEELPESLLQQVQQQVQELTTLITQHLEDQHRGEKIRQGVQVVICGKPNVGKSSLLNFFSGRDTAIVSKYAGTTRDVVESYLDLGGLLTIWADTAGIHATNDPVEAEGVKRAKQRLETADLRLLMFSAVDFDQIDYTEILNPLNNSSVANTLLIINKSELANPETLQAICSQLQQLLPQVPIFTISLQTGFNTELLRTAVIQQLTEHFSGVGVGAVITQERHRIALTQTLANLQAITLDKPLELLAEDLRLISRSLGKITGRIDAEDILNNIFAKFCIGK